MEAKPLRIRIDHFVQRAITFIKENGTHYGRRIELFHYTECQGQSVKPYVPVVRQEQREREIDRKDRRHDK